MASTHKKPSQVKKLQGTDRKDREVEDRMDPAKVLSVPKPPEYLGKHGKELWKNQLDQLAALKMLTRVDLVALGQYCQEWDIYRDAIADIKENGIKNIYDQVSASVTVKNQSFKNMLQIADRFGFVASAREKLTMPDQKDQDPLEKHMAKIHSINNKPEMTMKEWAEENNIHGRILAALKKADITSYSDLSAMSKKQVISIKGIGPTSLTDIFKAIKK